VRIQFIDPGAWPMEGAQRLANRNERPRGGKARASAVPLAAPSVEHRELQASDRREPVEARGQPAGAGELEGIPGLRAAVQAGQGLHAQERAQGREQTDAARPGLLDAGIGTLQGTQGLAAAQRQHTEGEMTVGTQKAAARRDAHLSQEAREVGTLRFASQRCCCVEAMAEEEHRHGLGQARCAGHTGGGREFGMGALRLAEHQGHQACRTTHDELGQRRRVAVGAQEHRIAQAHVSPDNPARQGIGDAEQGQAGKLQGDSVSVYGKVQGLLCSLGRLDDVGLGEQRQQAQAQP